MTDEDNNDFDNAMICHICDEEFDNSNKRCKVRDHDHLTGRYRGAAHACCNINYFSNRYLPVIFHNLRGYDSHLIIKEAWRLANKDKIDVIPNSTEKFMSFSFGKLKFIDSYQFLGCSLEKLVENLHGDTEETKYDNFHSIKRVYPEYYQMLCRKGYYPYEWVDDIDKLNHNGLPPIEAFYSKLSQKGISEDEYQQAWKVYNTLGCKSFRDYHMTYLKTDVLLLADVFENFRRTCIHHYKLDPANYISAPSLAWDAMLYKTGVKLDLVSDHRIMTMIEEQKRGGLCFVGSKRHAVANNAYLGDDGYDITKPINYIMYWDMNNLYGCAMIDYLPTGGHTFITEYDLQSILSTPDDSPVGYLLRVNLIFPKDKHELFRQYPPAPENTAPNKEWMSDYQNELAEKNNICINNVCKQSKLIPHLYPHNKYVIDYRNLKYLVSLGVEIEIVHDVIQYNQSRWLKPYIDFNTEMRKQARNDFEKDFFKLMNNSVYGKTMENVKNRMDLHLTSCDKNAVKWFSKSNLKRCTNTFGLYMIEMYKTKVVLDKPIYVGTTILDLSKLLMMKFHYDVIEKQFKGMYDLLYSDTDSLVYQIYCNDIYKWMGENNSLFDLSESVNPSLRDNTNKKKLGVMKDELNTLPIKEFISLCSKSYSYTYKDKIDIKNVKKLKGVSKATLKNNIKHDDYKDVLHLGKTISKPVVSIRSMKHQLYTIEQEKMCLNNWYDKSQLINAIDTLPYGYNI
jgi:hypothetical protein